MVFAFILALFDVLGEAVEEVVDDLGGEHLDVVLLGEGHRVGHHLHIEGEHARELFVHARAGRHQVFHGLQDVLFVHGADVNRTHWDFALEQELKQRLQRTNRGGLHTDSILGLVHVLLEDVNQIAFDLVDSILNLLLVGALEQL